MKKQIKCVKCGKIRNSKCRNDRPLCRECWVAEQRESKAARDAAIVCSQCGGKISKGAYVRGRKLCRSCARQLDKSKNEERRKAIIAQRNKENPLVCQYCGKPMTHDSPYASVNKKVCSVECSRKWAQQSTVKARETKEQLEHRLIEYIKEQGEYTSMAKLRESLHISDKLVYSRGISIPDLNYRAGVCSKPVANVKTYDELFEGYKNLIISDHSISINDAAKALDVSVDYITKMGIKVSEVRKAAGVHNGNSRTKEDVLKLVIPFIQQQGMYVPFEVIRKQFHLDYNSSFQRNGLTVESVNELAGFSNPRSSYWEKYAYKKLKEIFDVVEKQKTFEELRYKKLLRFDFFIPAYNALIEVNGDQHYDENSFFYCAESDQRYTLKRQYVEEHEELKLYELPITPQDTFKDRLNDVIHKIQGLCE